MSVYTDMEKLHHQIRSAPSSPYIIVIRLKIAKFQLKQRELCHRFANWTHEHTRHVKQYVGNYCKQMYGNSQPSVGLTRVLLYLPAHFQLALTRITRTTPQSSTKVWVCIYYCFVTSTLVSHAKHYAITYWFNTVWVCQYSSIVVNVVLFMYS